MLSSAVTKLRRISTIKFAISAVYLSFAIGTPTLLYADNKNNPVSNSDTPSIDESDAKSRLEKTPQGRMLLDFGSAPSLTLSEEEKALRQAMFFTRLGAMMPIMDACAQDVNVSCSSNENPMICLVDNLSSLEPCCQSHIRSVLGESERKHTSLHNNIMLPSGSSVHYDSSCKLSKATLSRPSTYKNLTLDAGPVFFNDKGEIDLTRLAGSNVWQGLPLAEDQPYTRVFANGMPEYVRLSDMGVYNGIPLQPMQIATQGNLNTIDLNNTPDEDVFFYLSTQRLVRDTGTTQFHANGKLARGHLSKDAVVNKIPLAAGLTTFNEQGLLIDGQLFESYHHGKWLLGKGRVTFSSDGKLLQANLAGPATVGGLELANGEITFYDNGNIRSAFMAKGALLNDHPLPAKTALNYDRNGQLDTIQFSYSGPITQSLDDHTYPFAGFDLRSNYPHKTYHNGQLQQVSFSDHKWYNERFYPKHTSIKLSIDGQVEWDSFYDEKMKDSYLIETEKLPEIIPFSQIRQGLYLPKGSIISKPYSSVIEEVILSRPVEYFGVRLAASNVKFSHQQKTLWLASLDGDQNVRGIPMAGHPKVVMFDSADLISLGYLAKNHKTNGVMLKQGEKIRINHNGFVVEGVLAQAEVVNDISMAAGTEIKFHDNGALQLAQLKHNQTVNGIELQKGTQVYFDDRKNIERGTLGKRQIVGKAMLPAGTTIRMLNGALIGVQTSDHVKIDQLTLDGRAIQLHDNGSLRTGIVANDSVINGNTVEAGTQILLDNNGVLVGKEFVGLEDSQNANAVYNMLIAPPKKSHCNELLKTPSYGYSVGAADVFTAKCKAFYAELQD